MNRNQFIGWDIQNKCLFPVVQIEYENDLIFLWREPYEGEKVDWVAAGFEVDKDCLMLQYTGMFDKNGVPLHEGSVFHLGRSNVCYTVVWDDCSFLGKQHGSKMYIALDYWKDQIESIGDIYTNPELNEISNVKEMDI